MANGRDNNVGNGLRPVFLALYFLGAVVSGAGGNYLWLRSTGPEVVRPDPFTGSDARQLQSEIDTTRRQFRYHIENHPDIENRFDARLTALEAQFVILIANQERILNRLDRLNGK